MRGGAVAVRLDPRDFRPQLRDPLGKLTSRIRVESLAGEQAGGVAARTGAIIVVHVREDESRAACCQRAARLGERA